MPDRHGFACRPGANSERCNPLRIPGQGCPEGYNGKIAVSGSQPATPSWRRTRADDPGSRFHSFPTAALFRACRFGGPPVDDFQLRELAIQPASSLLLTFPPCSQSLLFELNLSH